MSGISSISGYSGGVSRAGNNLDVVVGSQGEKSVSIDDFLNLMVAQLTNQDFMNPMEDTQYVTQLAQFATMQHMQELAYYSQSNYVTSLVGKDVTVAKLKLGGEIEKVEGKVERILLSDKEFMIMVDGKSYNLSQIMEIRSEPKSKPSEDEDATEETPSTEETPKE